jgi:hypothetical protein
MMDDLKIAPASPTDQAEPDAAPQADATQQADAAQPDAVPRADAAAQPQQPATGAPGDTPISPAVEKFRSCRWRAAPEDGEFCTHRDVLPFAGKEGFVAESWCPDCAFYKLRRTPKKRERLDFTY